MSIISAIPNEAHIQTLPWEQVGEQIKSVFSSSFGTNDVYIDSLNQEYSSSNSIWYTIERPQTEIAGWLYATLNSKTKQSYLAMIAVSKQWQGQGLAKKLIRYYIRDMNMRNILTITSKVRVLTLLPMLEKNFVVTKKGKSSLDLVDCHWYQQICMNVEENSQNM